LSRKDNRGLIDSKTIETYFNNNGFEIIYSEDFVNFEEQINYFYKVKTLASVSGSGLTNSIFMQPNTLILEIMTPYILDIISTDKKILEKKTEQLHYSYSLITFLKNQTHISIPNINLNIDNAILNLKNIGEKK
jgi:capsular polysaccharide biosynthesis protein